VVTWSLLRASKLASSESLNQKDQVTHERLISNDLTSLKDFKDSRNSGKIIQTRIGTIL